MDLIYKIMEKLLPFEWVSYDFMKNALLAVLVITPLFALMSTMIVNNKMSFFSDALGHSALAGIGIGVVLGIGDTTLATVVFAVIFALLLNYIKHTNTSSTDTVIGVFSSIGVALGIILLSGGGNFSHYQSLLIGDILSIAPKEIGLLLIVLVITVLFWIFGFNRLNAVCINPSLARSKGINTILMDNVFAVLIAVIVMLSIKWVGLLIINALLILPAASARFISVNMREYHAYSVVFSVFSGICGLIFSYYNEIPTGPTIVVIAGIIFFACFAAKGKIREI